MEKIVGPLAFFNYRRFHLGQTFILMGLLVFNIGLNWWMFEVSHSVWMQAVMNFMLQIPILLLSPLLSEQVHKYNRLFLNRKIHTIQIFFLASIIAAYYFLHDRVGLILMFAFFAGCLNAIEIIVKQDLIAELLPKEWFSQSVSLNALFSNSVRLVAPMCASWLLWQGNAGECFIFCWVCYMWMRWNIETLDWTKLSERAPKETIRVGNLLYYWGNSIRSGFRVASRHQEILLALLIMSSVSFCLGGYLSVLPAILKTKFDVSGSLYANMISLAGLGSLLVCLVFVVLRWRPRVSGLFYLLGLLWSGIGLLIYATHKEWAQLGMILIGGGLIGLNLAGSIVMQERVPSIDRLQLMSLFATMTMGIVPLGCLWLGFWAKYFGARESLMMTWILCVSFVVLLVGNYYLKRSKQKERNDNNNQSLMHK